MKPSVILVLPDELKVRWEQFSLDELLVFRSALWHATTCLLFLIENWRKLMEINIDCNCVICNVELVPQGGFGPMHLEMGNSNETIRKICMECAEKVKNATVGNVGKRSLALQAKWDKIAMRVPPEKRKAFLKFVNTGDADGDFLDWLDNDPFARKPVEMAYRATADFYEKLAENLPVELP